MDRDTAAATIEVRHGHALCAQDWEALHETGIIYYGDDAIDDSAINEAVDMLGRSWSPEARPADWAERSKTVFAGYQDDHRAALSILGLPKPVPLDQLATFVKERAEAERPEGDVLYLPYLVPGGTCQRIQVIRRGWSQTEGRAALGVDGKERDLIARSNGLGRVLTIAEGIVFKTGCTLAAVVTFLICGGAPMLPWISVKHRHRLGDVHPWVADGFTIEIGTPEVPVSAVAAAYRYAREQVVSTHASYGRRPTRHRSAVLLQFVGEHASQTWQERLAEWNQQYPDWDYKNLESMQSAYSRQKKRARSLVSAAKSERCGSDD